MKTRKELTREYKQRTPHVGVFQIKNKANGKIFVGSSTALDTIWNSIRFRLDSGNYPNAGLQHDWKSLGAEAFDFQILHVLKLDDNSTTDIRSELSGLEALTLEDLQPYGEKGYN